MANYNELYFSPKWSFYLLNQPGYNEPHPIITNKFDWSQAVRYNQVWLYLGSFTKKENCCIASKTSKTSPLSNSSRQCLLDMLATVSVLFFRLDFLPEVGSSLPEKETSISKKKKGEIEKKEVPTDTRMIMPGEQVKKPS